MPVIPLAVTIFSLIIVALASLLLLARRKLVASGDVTLLINDDPDAALRVAPGDTLLTSLARHDVLVPSACGGKGTCGLCKVNVEGGGQILPTEEPHLTRGEARQGTRLACQVKVKGDMKIEVPPELFNLRQFTTKVISNESVADFIKELVVELPPGEEVDFKAGQYLQFECPPHDVPFKKFEIGERFRKSWDRDDLWRHHSVSYEQVSRAYSMASCPQEKGILKFDIKIAPPPPRSPDGTPPGVMTSWLFSLKPGDEIEMSGPFGDFTAANTDAEMIFMGGGAGMAPLRSIICDQLNRVKTNRKISYWYRAHSLRDALYRDEMEKLAAEHDNFSFHLCLSKPEPEDEWTGYVGYLHDFLYDLYLKGHPAPEDCEYYLCGPRFLSIKILELLDELGVHRESIFYDNFAGEDKVAKQ